jgi:PPOX class probable F420-dependent enzyme
MTSLLDPAKERDAHIAQRLQQDSIVWLTSVRPDGRPHAVAVWFLWQDDTILIFSKPKNQKLRNLRQNPNIVLALDNTHLGSDPITIEGTAQLLPAGEADATLAAYTEKYREGIKRIGHTPESMAAEYSQAILITLTKIN